MDRILKWMTSIPTITGLAGFLAGLVLQAFGEAIPISQGLIMLILVIFVVLAVLVIYDNRQQSDLNTQRVKGIYSDVVDKLSSGMFTQVQYSSEGQEGDKDVYDFVKTNIESAQSSLRIVGFFRPPELPISQNRASYYKTIEDMIEDKLRSNSDFLYQRIIQVKEVRGSQLTNQQTDLITYEHCQKMLEKRRKGTVEIRLYQMLDVLGALSFVLVDDRVTIIGIPNVQGSSDNGPKALQQLKTTIIITDNQQRELTRKMSAYFRELQDSAVQIESVAAHP